MGDPPSHPAVKSTETLVSPGVRDVILGALGVVDFVTNRIVMS